MKTNRRPWLEAGLCLAALLGWCACARLWAAPWQYQAELAQGTVGGFIQVRENSVQGTPLALGPALGLNHAQHVKFSAIHRLGHTGALVLSAEFSRLAGTTLRSSPTYFNGVELAANSPLTTQASWLQNWQVTALYQRRLWGSASGMHLDGELGLTYVGLTYSLQGHPVGAASPSELSGSRTSEDFITQELPVPQFGLSFHYPLPASWGLEAEILGGHLPRLYSLRNEGGKVYVTQTNQLARLGADYRWGHNLRLGFGWYSRYFMQHEQSNEDGNYIRESEHGLYMNLRWRF